MEVVYAVETASVMMEGGYPFLVSKGSHWWADDPVVKAHSGLFSTDPRYGMTYSSRTVEDEALMIDERRATPRHR